MYRRSAFLSEDAHSFRRSICFVFFLYWFVLVAWQNMGGAELRGVADTMIKLLLLGYLLWSFFRKSRKIKRNIALLMVLFAFTQLITLYTKETISFYILVTYCFTTLFLLLTYGLGDSFEITQSTLIHFFYCIIAVVLYTIVYTIAVEPEQYATAFGANVGYGSEFHAFFISNNEFAIYCFYGVVAAVLLADMDSRIGILGKHLILLVATVFLMHVVISFSRVNIVCTVAFLILYVTFYKRSKCRKWVWTLVLFCIAGCLISSEIRVFLYEVAFKSGIVSSREELLKTAVDYYTRGSLFAQLFGYGITESRSYLEGRLGLGSVHNGYVQVLLYYGVTGLIWMLAMLGSQLVDSLRMLRKDKFVASFSIGLIFVAAANMVTSTQIVFTSPIDSFFLTAMFVVIPKYIRNAVKNDRFYSKKDI